MSTYEIKGVKTFRGMEGEGFNATLYREGKKVCFIIDEANGGCYNYCWFDYHIDSRVEVKGVHYLGEKYSYEGSPEEAKFHEFLMDLPWEKSEVSEKPYPIDKDTFIARLIDGYERVKEFKKICNKGLCVQVGEDIGTDKYVSFPIQYAKVSKAWVDEQLRKRYPNQKILILNEIYG
jgi:hypothetical protein